MKIIKSHTYNIINPEPFEIPFPLVFELLSGNTLLVEYTISETGVVDYSFNPNTNEKILTSVRRALTLNDIFFLFTSRIFPDKTPYTAMEMERFEVYEYHPYNIIRKTRGMLPGDKYWLRFEGESINYKTALDEHRAYYERSYKRYMDALEAAQTESETTPPSPLQGGESDDAEVPESTVAQEVSAVLASEPDSDVMSEDMIASLLSTLGDEVGEATTPPVPAETAPAEEIHEEAHELTDDEVGEILKHTKEANGVEVKMSDDEIAALLAANSAPADEGGAPSESEGRMFEPDSGTHEKMSDDAIAALLAANSAPAEPEPEPVAAEPAPSNEKMSDDAIAALLAANSAPAEPEPEPVAAEPAPSNEKMSDDAIAALLAANSAPAEPEPEPVAAEPAPSNEKMSDDAIAALLAQNQ